MTATIVAWEITIAASASRPFAVAPAVRTAATKFMRRCGSNVAPLTTSGSGRNRANVLAAASNKNTDDASHGPLYVASPNHSLPAHCAGATSNGPNTAPNVDANTTRLIANERWFGSARSVAAYRASKFAA